MLDGHFTTQLDFQPFENFSDITRVQPVSSEAELENTEAETLESERPRLMRFLAVGHWASDLASLESQFSYLNIGSNII